MKLKLTSTGKVYDIAAGARKVSLTTLAVLQRDYGVSMKIMDDAAQRFNKAKSPMEALDDPQVLLAFRVMVWLARRAAGEVLTLDEATDFPMDEVEWVPEPGDPAPKEMPAPNRAARRATTKSRT